MRKPVLVVIGSIATLLMSMLLARPSYGQGLKTIDAEATIRKLQLSWQRLEEAQQQLHEAAEEIRRLKDQVPTSKQYKVTLTSYNPVKGQTDNSPCVGAAGINLCDKMKEPATSVIALAQNLVGRDPSKPFHYGDIVALNTDDCPYYTAKPWGYVVLDTMNERFTNYADIFHMDAKDNFGKCHATISKVSK